MKKLIIIALVAITSIGCSKEVVTPERSPEQKAEVISNAIVYTQPLSFSVYGEVWVKFVPTASATYRLIWRNGGTQSVSCNVMLYKKTGFARVGGFTANIYSTNPYEIKMQKDGQYYISFYASGSSVPFYLEIVKK